MKSLILIARYSTAGTRSVCCMALFEPNSGSSIVVKVCHAQGKAFSVKIAASHDYGTAAVDGNTWHMIDAAFHRRLPGGRSEAQVLAAPVEWIMAHSVPPMRVVGMLSSMQLAFKVVSDSFSVSDEQRFGVRLPLVNVLIVDGLPVPVHVSIKSLLKAANDVSNLEAVVEACGSPGLDDRALEPELPLSYQKHAYWSSLAAGGGAGSAMLDAERRPEVVRASQVASSGSYGFESAASFDGARDGHVFKLGPQGLGYYQDTPQVVAPWLREKIADTRHLTGWFGALGLTAVLLAASIAVVH